MISIRKSRTKKSSVYVSPYGNVIVDMREVEAWSHFNSCLSGILLACWAEGFEENQEQEWQYQ